MPQRIFHQKIIISQNKFHFSWRKAGGYFSMGVLLVTIFFIKNTRAILNEQQIQTTLDQDIRFQEMTKTLESHVGNLKEVNSVVSGTVDDLQKIRSEKATLGDQLDILEELAQENESEVASIGLQIDDKKAEIALREIQLESIQAEITAMKEVLKKYAQILYHESGKSTLELLLQSKTFAEAVASVRDVELIESEGEMIFARIRSLYRNIDEEKRQIAADTRKLELWRDETLQKRNEIILTTAARQSLLTLTQNNEKRFQILLKIAKERQAELSKKVEDLTSKLALDRQEIIEDLQLQAEHTRKLGKDMTFLWPVSPKRGITAYFNDNTYQNYYGVPHKALDIRVAQGTSIVAPAYGYVYRTYQNGLDYAYILLAHADNTFTLYGHVNKILVKEGEMVEKGQMIGKTGGMPGTIGSGMMTTGPHLHFEVHKGGEKIDPLLVLPLSAMNREDIPEKLLLRSGIDTDKTLNSQNQEN